ncbi:MAG: hypothetical protein ACK40O_04755 [Allosphingosinicella sp.]
MTNTSPPRYVRTAAPNRQAAIGQSLRQAIGKTEMRLPAMLRRLLARLDRNERPRPE